MTFTAACGWSLLRSAVVAVIGLWGAVHLTRLVSQQRGAARIVAWVLILAPFLSPGLIVGYGYRNYSLSLVHHPAWNELLYVAILIGQAAPIGALLLYFAPPPPVSASGVHVWRMGAPTAGGAAAGVRLRARLQSAMISLRGPRQAWLPAAAVIFLIAFQESETAALLQVHGWPEWLFTRYAGLVDLTATRYRMLELVAIQAVVLVPVVAWVWRSLATGRRPERTASVTVSNGWWLWPCGMCILDTLLPCGVVLRGAWQGLESLRQQPSFWQELLHGLAFAMTAGAIACTLAGGLIRKIDAGPAPVESPQPRSSLAGLWRPLLLGLLLLPGLCGSMTLALLVDDLFQRSWLQWAYDSPARILTALTLILFPRAVLVQTCVPFDRRTTELHAAGLLSAGASDQRRAARELDWRLRGRPRFWSYVLVCSWGYLDLMIATISAPPGMEPVVKRLYNFMHFGHIAGLSAMVCVTVAAPLLLAAAFLFVRRWRTGWTAA
ncbi:MAG: hypothetical protein U0992_11505 [Planctomycetaceae bacterium]